MRLPHPSLRWWWLILPFLISADKVTLFNTKQNRGSSHWRFYTCSDFTRCATHKANSNPGLGWVEQTISTKGPDGTGSQSSYQAITACDTQYQTDTQPDLWAISSFIKKKHLGAKFVDLELKTLVNLCDENDSPSYCRNDVDIYYQELDEDERVVDVTRFIKIGQTSSSSDSIELQNTNRNSAKFGTKLQIGPIRTSGFILAFRDRGSCTALGPIVISYNYCPSITRSLAKFPTSFYDPSHHSSQIKGQCVENSGTLNNQVYMTCDVNGKWINYEGSCACGPGFQPMNAGDQKCVECPANQYKNTISNDKCTRCPKKSWSEGRTGATECPCVDGHYRVESEGPHVPCSSVPSAPRNLTLTAAATSVELNWKMPDDIGGRFDTMRYRIQCFNEDTSTNHPESPFVILGSTNFYVPNLTPNTLYSFTVTAFNSVTRFHFATMDEALSSNSSTTTSCRTRPVYQIKALQFTPTKVHLQWPVEFRNRNVPWFDIKTDVPEVQNRSRSNNVWLTNLKPGKKYKVIVQADPLKELKFYQAEMFFITPKKEGVEGVTEAVVPVVLPTNQSKLPGIVTQNPVLIILVACGLFLSIILACMCYFLLKREHSESEESYDNDGKHENGFGSAAPFINRDSQFQIDNSTWKGYLQPQQPQMAFPPYGENSSPQLLTNPPGNTFQNNSSSTIYTNVLEDKVSMALGGLKNYVSPDELVTDSGDITGKFKKFVKEISDQQIRYVGRIGEGHYGEVFKAVWGTSKGEVVVAVKKLRENETDLKQGFLREAAILGQLDCEFIVRMHGVQYQTDVCLIVTEFMEHGSLQDFVRNQCSTLQNSTLLRLLSNISDAMYYLTNTVGYTHRDIAARNCLVGYTTRRPSGPGSVQTPKRHSNSADEGVVVVSDTDSDISRQYAEQLIICKLADFGQARPITQSHISINSSKQIPLRWTSPEAVLCENFGEKSDVWSFGVLAYEVLSRGERPFWNLSDQELYNILQLEGLQNMTQVLHCPVFIASAYFHQLITQCLYLNPDNRPNFQNLCKTLKNLQFNHCAESTMPDPSSKIPEPPHHHHQTTLPSSSLSLWLASVSQIPHSVLYQFLRNGIVTTEQVQQLIDDQRVAHSEYGIEDKYTFALIKRALKNNFPVLDLESIPVFSEASTHFMTLSHTDHHQLHHHASTMAPANGRTAMTSQSFSYHGGVSSSTKTLGIYNGNRQHHLQPHQMSKNRSITDCMVVEV